MHGNEIEPFGLVVWRVDSRMVSVGYWNEEVGEGGVNDDFGGDMEHRKEEG
jgi:hypothetical protein